MASIRPHDVGHDDDTSAHGLSHMHARGRLREVARRRPRSAARRWAAWRASRRTTSDGGLADRHGSELVGGALSAPNLSSVTSGTLNFAI